MSFLLMHSFWKITVDIFSGDRERSVRTQQVIWQCPRCAKGAGLSAGEWNHSKAQELTVADRWKSQSVPGRSLCPPSPFVLLICLFLVSIQSRPSWVWSVERPRHNMMAVTDEWASMLQDPPGVLQGACSSRMPGMAQGSQRHEPPTLNKRLAVVPGLDPVSS